MSEAGEITKQIKDACEPLTLAAICDAVLARAASEATRPEVLALPDVGAEFRVVPPNRFWQQGMTDALWRVHDKWAAVFEPLLGTVLPAGRSRDFDRYRREWHGAIIAGIAAGYIDRGEAPKQYYVIRDGVLGDAFTEPRDTKAAKIEAIVEKLEREESAARTAHNKARTQNLLDPGPTPRRAKAPTKDGIEFPEFLCPDGDLPPSFVGTSWRRSKSNPHGAMDAHAIEDLFPDHWKAALSRCTAKQRQIFELYTYGLPKIDDQPDAVRGAMSVDEIADFLRSTGQTNSRDLDSIISDVKKILARVREHFQAMGLPDPVIHRRHRPKPTITVIGSAWADAEKARVQREEEEFYSQHPEAEAELEELDRQLDAAERHAASLPVIDPETAKRDEEVIAKCEGKNLASFPVSVRHAFRAAIRRQSLPDPTSIEITEEDFLPVAEQADTAGLVAPRPPCEADQVEQLRQWLLRDHANQKRDDEARLAQVKAALFGVETPKKSKISHFSQPHRQQMVKRRHPIGNWEKNRWRQRAK